MLQEIESLTEDSIHHIGRQRNCITDDPQEHNMECHAPPIESQVPCLNVCVRQLFYLGPPRGTHQTPVDDVTPLCDHQQDIPPQCTVRLPQQGGYLDQEATPRLCIVVH